MNGVKLVGSMMVRGNLDQPFVRSKTVEGARRGLFLPEYMGNPCGTRKNQ
jgi:hypothetical protein